MDEVTFKEYLTKKRNKAGLSIYKLAKLSGVSHSYISQLERGIKEEPSPEILKKLSKPLGVSYNEMLLRAGHVDKQEFEYLESNQMEKWILNDEIAAVLDDLSQDGHFLTEVYEDLSLIFYAYEICPPGSEAYNKSYNAYVETNNVDNQYLDSTLIENFNSIYTTKSVLEEIKNISNEKKIKIYLALIKVAQEHNLYKKSNNNQRNQTIDTLKTILDLSIPDLTDHNNNFYPEIKDQLITFKEKYQLPKDLIMEPDSLKGYLSLQKGLNDPIDWIPKMILEINNLVFTKQLNILDSPSNNLAVFLEKENINYNGKPITKNKRKQINMFLEVLFEK